MGPWPLWARLLGHMAQIVALGFDCWVEKPCHRIKKLHWSSVGGTWTRVLADSMAIAACALIIATPKQLQTGNWYIAYLYICIYMWVHVHACGGGGIGGPQPGLYSTLVLLMPNIAIFSVKKIVELSIKTKMPLKGRVYVSNLGFCYLSTRSMSYCCVFSHTYYTRHAVVPNFIVFNSTHFYCLIKNILTSWQLHYHL